MNRLFTTSFLSLALVSAGRACSVCGCSLSSDWEAQGYSMMPGFETGGRFEYSDQSNLRSGSSSVARSALPVPNDDEIQQDTLNRAFWLSGSKIFTSNWAVEASLPWYDRFHSTISPGDTAISTSHATGLGDLRVEGRYQDFNPHRSYSLEFGFKLPTGRYDQNFATGPAAGQLLDRGLQLGTGTTDLLLGAASFVRPFPWLGAFGQATLDQPLAGRAGFVPSTSVTVNTGLRYLNATDWVPQFQLNAREDSREHGSEGDTANSGGTFLYVSPGVTYGLGEHGSLFAFFQLPVYQRVNGLQLEPRWLISAGFRWKL